MAEPAPVRPSQLPPIPPPEWEHHTWFPTPDGGGDMVPGQFSRGVLVRRRVTYGDWEPVHPDRWAGEPEAERLKQVGWYCWRCQAINTHACRSDSVPVLVPADWADDMRTEVAKRDEDDEDEDGQPTPASDENRPRCGPECSEQHMYAYRCALKPPPMDPAEILGAAPAPAEPAPATAHTAALRHLIDRAARGVSSLPEGEQLRKGFEQLLAERARLAATIDRMNRTNRMVNGGARRERERAEEAEAALARARDAAHITDSNDVTEWQRGYRACADRLTTALDIQAEA